MADPVAIVWTYPSNGVRFTGFGVFDDGKESTIREAIRLLHGPEASEKAQIINIPSKIDRYEIVIRDVKRDSLGRTPEDRIEAMRRELISATGEFIASVESGRDIKAEDTNYARMLAAHLSYTEEMDKQGGGNG